ARGINFRTMELFRELGVEEQLRAAGTNLTNSRGMLVVESLAGAEYKRISMEEIPRRSQPFHEISPTNWCMCAQDQSEPVLFAAARQRGGDLRFNTELLSFEQDDTGVTAIVVNRADGTRRTIRADYMIAADGAASPIRNTLGISRSGTGTLGHNISIYFSADLADLVQGREFVLCLVENREVQGVFVSVNNKDLWIFSTPYAPERGESLEDFPPERCIDLIRKAVGLPQIAIEIKSILPWEAAVRVADRFQQGRVFLAGDSAHQMPPTGAFGASTGIQDAHNLAWKLAAVLKGQTSPALLATYDEERRPIARFTAEQAGLRSAITSFEGSAANGTRLADNLVIIVGYQYTSQAIISDDEAPLPLDHLELDGHPGRRAPHLWLERQGQRISTLDLFGTSFVLLAGEDGSQWRDAALAIAACRGIDLDAYCVGPTGDLIDLDERWPAAYGVTSTGAVLVRPDGFVAWRAQDSEQSPEQTLEAVLDHLLPLGK
ncbi:MAG: FAD-dependent monooxygenase, partial [Chloroflexi bacterium]|nr:FAD-dependent monooxygenase [Chloroflexota bacterium]